MAPKTKEQFKEMRERSYTNILEAAFDLFSYHGFSDTTIEMIAQRAGISKGLIYNYFDSKKDILSALLDKVFTEIQASIPNLYSIQDPLERLKQHIENAILSIKENDKFWKLQLQLLSQPATRSIALGELLDFLGSLSVMVEGIFKERKVENPSMEAMLLNLILDGVMLRYILSENMFPIDIVKTRLIQKYCEN